MKTFTIVVLFILSHIYTTAMVQTDVEKKFLNFRDSSTNSLTVAIIHYSYSLTGSGFLLRRNESIILSNCGGGGLLNEEFMGTLIKRPLKVVILERATYAQLLLLFHAVMYRLFFV